MVPQSLYHIFNRGIDKQIIFFNKDNYYFFLSKIKKHLLTHLDIIAYCLMPNHFHLLIYTKEDIVSQNFSKDFRIMLSSYTKAVNHHKNRTGSLFQQHSKIKNMEEDANYFKNEPWSNMINHEEYANTCFHYIHMNPVKAHLVPKMENWEMSSYRDYAGYRKISLCSKKLAYELMNIPEEPELFMKQSNNQILCNHMSW